MMDTGYNSYTAILTRRATGYADENGQRQNAERPTRAYRFPRALLF